MEAARTPLTRERMLAAALECIDEEGLSALTMRRLGARLQRDPMALYRHAKNRAELLDGVVELVLSQLRIDPDHADWQRSLRAAAHRFRGLALAHPNVVPLIATRPLATPLALRPVGTLRPLEHVLGLLDGAGFAPVDALRVYRSYFGLLLGHVLTELQEVVVDQEEADDLLRTGLHRLPLREFPRLRGLASALVEYDGGEELDHSVTILLSGLTRQLIPSGGEPRG